MGSVRCNVLACVYVCSEISKCVRCGVDCGRWRYLYPFEVVVQLFPCVPRLRRCGVAVEWPTSSRCSVARGLSDPTGHFSSAHFLFITTPPRSSQGLCFLHSRHKFVSAFRLSAKGIIK
ncbi:hypothetical protein, unlikely [Trypanosoma congolense IL3000]|uniref:Uncharacterized protein n=1 Tax=Trypanosoma congolense (strain IL3000) TaxID=1068625 RepID=F9W9H9_TRYCI|nr:hypothetical protein, unlikely [Trypanosoma congolense IL3000]